MKFAQTGMVRRTRRWRRGGGLPAEKSQLPKPNNPPKIISKNPSKFVLVNCSLTISATRSLYTPTHCSIPDESKTRPTSKSQEASRHLKPRTARGGPAGVPTLIAPSACESLIYRYNKARTLCSGEITQCPLSNSPRCLPGVCIYIY